MDSAATGSLREAKARAVQDFERTYIVRLLRTYEGNISEAARAAKKNRRAFWELMRKYRVRADEYRGETARKGPAREGSSSTLSANC
jgi:two-component system, NtrC family, response regulator GlrR